MKARILLLSLVLTTLLTLTAGAFSDVPADAWYAHSVSLCQETGLLKGTGVESFSPNASVTVAEVMTVAARLHHRLATGEQALSTAPERWGNGSIHTPAGALLLSFSTGDPDRGLEYYYDFGIPRRVHLYLNVTPQELAALTPAGDASQVTLKLNETQVLSGFLAPAGDGSTRMEFIAVTNGQDEAFQRELSTFLAAPACGLWYRDALWYSLESDLFDGNLTEGLFDDPATRDELAGWLSSALVAAQLPDINSIDHLPDTDDPDVLALYRAGILGGTDEKGTFFGDLGLTRAELATVLSRVEDPAERIDFGVTSLV